MYIKSIFLICSLFLVGCGGGTPESNPDNNPDGNPPVVEADTIPPVITLNGKDTIQLLKGTNYIEEGATAIDNIDGEVPVTISGEVKKDVLGYYTLTYSAQDSSFNSSKKTRLVKVVSEIIEEKETVIDILAIYNNEADAEMNGNAIGKIEQMIAYANEVNKRNGLNLTLRLVHSELINIDQSKTSGETLNSILLDQNIINLRNEYKADEVLIFRPYSNDGYCGLAYVNTGLSSDFAYGHITIECPTDTLAHEIGHNYGLSHSHKQGGTGIYSYSFGHGVMNEFSTIMSYTSVFNTMEVTPVYSSPLLDCNGQPCGIEEGYDGEADSARSISEVKEIISNFN